MIISWLSFAFYIWATARPVVRNECVLSKTLIRNLLFLGFLIPEISDTLKAETLSFPKLLQLFTNLSPLLCGEFLQRRGSILGFGLLTPSLVYNQYSINI